MPDNKVKIIIETDAGRSEQVLNGVRNNLTRVENAQRQAGKSAKEASSDFEKAERSLKETAAAIGKALAVIGTVKKAYDFTREAAMLDEARTAFKNYADSVGGNANKILAALKKASNGTVAEKNLISTASKALALRVTTDADKIGKLMEIARAKSKLFGTEVTASFNDIVTGIGRGSPQILDNLGIKIPAGFAEMTKGMDSAQKTAVLLNEVIKSESENLNALSDDTESSADQFRKFEVALNELKTDIAEKFIPTATTLVTWLKDVVKWGKEGADAIEWVIKGDKVFKKEQQDLSKLGPSGQIEELRKKREELNSQFYQKNVDIWVAKNYKSIGALFTSNSTIKEWEKEARDLQKQIKQIDNDIANLQQKGREIVKQEQQVTAEKEKQIEVVEMTDAERAQRERETQQLLQRIQQEQEKKQREADKLRKKEIEQREKILELQKKQREEAEKAFKAYANYASETLPKIKNITEKIAVDEAIRITKVLGGFSSGYNAIEASAKKWEQANKFKNVDAGTQRSRLVGSVLGQTVASYLPQAAVGSFKTTEATEVAKKGWNAIKGQVIEGFSDAVTSGIINSNLGDALRGAISSIAAGKAQSYGGTILSNLFSGKGLSGIGGALSGFVGSVAVSAIANNWKKWFSDRGKQESIAKNQSTVQSAVNAYFSTYSAMFNPYMTDDLYEDLLGARWDYLSGNLTVSNKGKSRGGLSGLAGYKDYRDTTSSSTYSLIDAINNTVKTVDEYNKYKEKELELLEAQGKDYQVLGTQVDALKQTMDRVQSYGLITDDWTFWGNMKGAQSHYELDLSDNVQDLKKAYYEALRQYGEETGARNQQKANTFLSLYPFLDDYSMLYSRAAYATGYNRIDERARGITGKGLIQHYTPTYLYKNRYYDTDDTERTYSFISQIQENLLDKYADPRMLELIKQAGKEQYNLASLQYDDDGSQYTAAYLNMLERQQDAAELVMQEQEQIYLDMTKTFEEQSAALETYQQAQEQYYNTKLEILAQERAKEEQLKKEEQQAKLRSADRMEALLGFTGEMARTNNKIYILEGADQIGALRELEQYIDDPEALSFVKRLMTAATNKNKYGKIA